jgi:hypothetical protein
MSHTCLQQTRVSRLPQIHPKRRSPHLRHRITSRQHKSSYAERLGSLKDLASLHLRLLQNRRVLLALLQDALLGCAPLCLYRHRSMPILASLCPWVSRPIGSPSCAPLQSWVDSSCGRVQTTCPANTSNSSFHHWANPPNS